MVNVKQKFNKILDENMMINSITELKEEIKFLRKGNALKLTSLLIFASVCTMFMSFVSSIAGYGNASRHLAASLAANIITVWINNLIFIAFIKRVRNETYDGTEISYFTGKILPQIICAMLLSLCQSFVMVCLVQVTSFIPKLYVVVSILVSTFFTLLNAMAAFRIYDRKTKVKNILPGAFRMLARYGRVIIFISLLFLTWSYVSNMAFNGLLMSQIQIPQGINNIFHSFLNQHDYMNMMKVGGYYAANYLVGGFLEVDLLLGLAVLYQRNRTACFHEK